MKFLENRTKDSKREMDILDALDEIRNMSRQNAKITPEQLFEYLTKRDSLKMSEEEEKLLNERFKQKQIQSSLKTNKTNDEESLLGPELQSDKTKRQSVEEKLSVVGDQLWTLHTKVLLKKKITEPEPIAKTQSEAEEEQLASYKFPNTSLLCDYSDDEDEDKEVSLPIAQTPAVVKTTLPHLSQTE